MVPTDFLGEEGGESSDSVSVLARDVLADVGGDGHSLEQLLAGADNLSLCNSYT